MKTQSDAAPRGLFGRVVDDHSNRPLAGATVQADVADSPTVTTDESGAFLLPVPPTRKSVELRISFGGTELARQAVPITGTPANVRVARPTAAASTSRARTAANANVPSRGELRWLTRAVADARIARAANHATATVLPDALVGGDECTCETCLSAVSPVAYLADLLSYVTSAVTNSGAPIDLGWLEQAFHQPFGELLVSCADVDRTVRQVRICIEVLRRFLTTPQPVPGEDGYRLAAYRQLLHRQGTSVDEIRLAAHADAKVRIALAQRLGIATGPRPDRLDALSLPTDAVTEEILETLFGLIDTTLSRNPLSDGVTRNDATGQLQRWNVEGVAWGRNTDADGVGYLSLSNTAQAAEVSIYCDSARTQLVASGAVPQPGSPVTLASENGGFLTGRIELQPSADNATIELQLIPKLVAWRLDRLRSVWAEADRPSNVFVDLSPDLPAGERRPIIDPDVIGVDDFRYPYPAAKGDKDAAFDIWLRRRQFVDAALQELALLTKQMPTPTGPITVPDFARLLARNFKPVHYGPASNPPVDVWAPLTVADLDKTARELTRPDTAAAAASRVADGFRLELTAFARLLELRVRDRNGELLVADEWSEVFSILVQAQKRALVVATTAGGWIAEETALAIDLGPETFWIAETEPKPGEWPPAIASHVPLIEPGLRRIDLPDDVAGRRALALWRARSDALVAFADKLQDAHDAHPLDGFEPLFVLAFGAAPAGGWVAHLQALGAALDGPNPGPAQQEITTKLHLALEDFPRLISLTERAQPATKGPGLAPSEWDEVYGALTAAAKVGQMYPAWSTEEHKLGFDSQYWWARKAALPLWRGAADQRAVWQEALADRSAPSIVDPDQLDIVDFIDPDPRDSAYNLYQQREQALANEATALGQFLAGLTQPLETFDALIVTVLFAESDDTKLALAGPLQTLAADRAAFGTNALSGLLQQVSPKDSS